MMNRTTRRIFWLVMLLWLLVGVVGSKAVDPGIGGLAFFAMVGWWFLGAFFSRLIGSMLISSIHCPGCQLEIPAVDRWKVGAYTDHRERHFLFAKDPISGARVGHVDCPQCSCTILL